ncbi:MAG: hypothetical protein JXQ23_11095 [Clostridia bacterium]|nr:hypothetical protein [Clostridia bacterium]
MKVCDIAKILNGNILFSNEKCESDFLTACGADLMSDVMAFARDNEILLTGLTNPQVVRTAEMMDIKAIVFVRGKVPPEVSLDLARELGVNIICTKLPMFVACGKLYEHGITGGVHEE